jgi:hypothetical protein
MNRYSSVGSLWLLLTEELMAQLEVERTVFI